MRRKLLCAFLLIYSFSPLQAQSDSTPLSISTYLKMVLMYSPQANQADLIDQNAEAYVLKARSKFEPKLNSTYTSKDFDGKNYFSNFNSEVKIPTYLGLSIKGGYEAHDGLYLNPESTVPASGLIYSGVEWSIGNGLFMDDRRAGLRNAQVQFSQALLEETWQKNEWLYISGLSYIHWEYQNNVVENFRNLLQVNQDRLDQIRQSYLNGDKPAIDTLEAFILLQNRQNQLYQASWELRKKSNNMKQYLWPDFLPASVISNWRPTESEPILSPWVVETLDSNITPAHPLIRTLSLDLERNTIQQRLNRERFKPTVDVGYNFLTEASGAPQGQAFQLNNNKVMATVQMPLLLREARSTRSIIDLKETELELKLAEKQNALVLKVDQLEFQDSLLTVQIEQMREIRDNYQRLLDAEIIKFNIGESSVFLINARENKLLEYNLKLLKLQAKQSETKLELLYIKGLLLSYIES
jgi:hypothetical protein